MSDAVDVLGLLEQRRFDVLEVAERAEQCGVGLVFVEVAGVQLFRRCLFSCYLI